MSHQQQYISESEQKGVKEDFYVVFKTHTYSYKQTDTYEP